MGRTVVFFNHKGGVGKTTTACNVAAALALRQKKTLLIDYDPQANATVTCLGIAAASDDPVPYSSVDLTMGGKFFSKVENVQGIKGLDLVVTNILLGDLELDITLRQSIIEGARQLRKALTTPAPTPVQTKEGEEIKQLSVIDQYDFIIIDAAPSFGMISLNALVAADELIIPVEMEPLGMRSALRLITKVEAGMALNPTLRVLGVIATKVDERSKKCMELLSQVNATLGKKMFKTVIHTASDARWAPGEEEGKLIVASRPALAVSKEFVALADEIINRRTP